MRPLWRKSYDRFGSIATIRHSQKPPFTTGGVNVSEWVVVLRLESVADNQPEQVVVFNQNGWLFLVGIRSNVTPAKLPNG